MPTLSLLQKKVDALMLSQALDQLSPFRFHNLDNIGDVPVSFSERPYEVLRTRYNYAVLRTGPWDISPQKRADKRQ
jgi:hypothetical protein